MPSPVKQRALTIAVAMALSAAASAGDLPDCGDAGDSPFCVQTCSGQSFRCWTLRHPDKPADANGIGYGCVRPGESGTDPYFRFYSEGAGPSQPIGGPQSCPLIPPPPPPPPPPGADDESRYSAAVDGRRLGPALIWAIAEAGR